MMPTSPPDFHYFLFFTSLVDWIRIASLSVRHYLPMDTAKRADVSCSSSYAPAMSPYIYLMTHILLIASSSIPAPHLAHLLLIGTCATINHKASPAQRCPARWSSEEGTRVGGTQPKPPNSLFHPSL